MPESFESAGTEDAEELPALHTDVAEHLTRMHGQGPWSMKTSAKGVSYALRTSSVFVAREAGRSVATLRLGTKRPWAIEVSYFTPCKRPLYLLSMAVAPARQGEGIGRRWKAARAWPADAVRFGAYNAQAGAGGFYARCGCKESGRVTCRNAPLIYFEVLL
jgi:GNAT superfamily N-acetyltransferase